MKNATERIKLVKAMEYIARQVNDERHLYGWLMCGVADGDIEYGDLSDEPGNAIDYAEDDDTFRELIGCFLRKMRSAGEAGGLHCDGVVATIKD